MILNVLIKDLRLRDGHSLSSKVLGYVSPGIHEYTDESNNDGYTWYHVEDGWIAGVPDGVEIIWEEPKPVEVDDSKDQVYVDDVLVNIRYEASTSSKKMGMFKPNSYYNVLEVVLMSDYTWYKVGEHSYMAGIDEVHFFRKGQSRKALELREKIKQLKESLEIADECIASGKCDELYNETYDKIIDLQNTLDKYDIVDYDYVSDKECKEIDVLNTTDVHGSWYDYDMKGCYNTPKFSYNDIGKYRDKLEAQGISTIIVDCGDWSRPGKVEENEGNDAIKAMSTNGFLFTTPGNHEWKWQWGAGASKSMDILSRLKCVTACNIFKNGKTVFKPYRACKFGKKKLAIIGVGYPSPNGYGTFKQDDTWEYDGYTFYDGSKLYAEVQKYIDMFKKFKFDYVLVATHMDKFSEEDYEDDNRSIARSDLLIQNTSGLTALLQGHFNYRLNPATVLDKNGNKVLICYDAGSNMDCFGRLRIKSDGTLSSTLITDRGEL